MKKKSNGKKRTITKTIVIGFTSLTFGLLFSLGVIIYLLIKPINEASFTDKLSTTMRLTDTGLSAFLNGISTSVIELSADSGNYEENYDEIYKFQQLIVDYNDNIVSAIVAYADETVISYPNEIDAQTALNSSWYMNATDYDGTTAFSTLYENESGILVVAASYTVYNDEGELVGVAALEIEAQQLGNLLGDETSMGDIKFILIDGDENVILDPFNPVLTMKKASDTKIASLKDYMPGSYGISHENVEGIGPCEIRILPSQNDLFALDYAMIIPMKTINQSTNAISMVIVIALIGGLIVATLVSIIIAKSITASLKKIIAILKNIASGDGDLTVRLPVLTEGEIGQLGTYFNMTIEKIEHSLESIINESKTMEDVGTRLSDNMTSSANAIEQISTNISTIKNDVVNQSAGVEQTNSTMNQIANNIELLNKNIAIQSDTVQQSSASVEQMVANINSVTDILEKNQENVRQLQESSEAGKEIVTKVVEITNKVAEDSAGLIETSKVIQTIASQTNLLAMNAAIEAAHAGESGRGFAVVADEIRKLAEDSNKQGKKINDVLKHLREMILTMTQDATEMSRQFNVIFDHTQTVSAQEGIIKSAMDEQSAGSKQVIEAMGQINQITGDVKQSSMQMEEGSKEVLVEMEKLASVTLQINSSMNQMTNNIQNVTDSIHDVDSLSNENQMSIQRVSAEINKFKVSAEIQDNEEVELND